MKKIGIISALVLLSCAKYSHSMNPQRTNKNQIPTFPELYVIRHNYTTYKAFSLKKINKKEFILYILEKNGPITKGSNMEINTHHKEPITYNIVRKIPRTYYSTGAPGNLFKKLRILIDKDQKKQYRSNY